MYERSELWVCTYHHDSVGARMPASLVAGPFDDIAVARRARGDDPDLSIFKMVHFDDDEVEHGQA